MRIRFCYSAVILPPKDTAMRPLFKTAIAGLLLSLISVPAFAGTEDIRASDRAVEFEAGASKLRYGETNSGLTFDTESGWMPSFDAGLTWLTAPSDKWWWSNIYLHTDIQATVGDTHYSGALNTIPPTPIQSTTHDQIYTVSGRFGRSFTLADGIMLTPTGDLGFRAWQRKLTGTGGYVEHYNNGEFMGGLLLQASPIPKLVLSLSGEGGTTFSPYLKTSIAGTLNPGTSAIWKFQGKIGYAITPKFEVTTSAGLQGFGFKQSPVNQFGAYEPSSYTHQLTIMGGLAYHLY